MLRSARDASVVREARWRFLQGVFLLLIFLFLVGLIVAPRETAKKEHKAYWGKEAQ